MIIQPSRRGFLLGLGASIAAPATVRASWIMPVKKWIDPPPKILIPRIKLNGAPSWTNIGDILSFPQFSRKNRYVVIEIGLGCVELEQCAPADADDYAPPMVFLPECATRQHQKSPL